MLTIANLGRIIHAPEGAVEGKQANKGNLVGGLTSYSPLRRRPLIIIDTDPGVDDVIAILMALASTVPVVGLTTVGGNASLSRTTRNALAILEQMGRKDIPVSRGSARPLTRWFIHSSSYHGRGGLPQPLPAPRTLPVKERAVEFLIRNLSDYHNQISLVSLGPLTNLAKVVQATAISQPELLASTVSMTIMGGAVDFLGNSTPYSEFNFYNDPLAAHLVLNSGFPVTLVDLRAGSQVTITREQAAALKADNAIGRLVIEILNSWFQRDPLRERFNFDDPLALAVSLNPQLIATQTVTIEVEHTNTLRWGESRITTCSGNVALATTVDTQGFFTLLKELLGLQGLEV